MSGLHRREPRRAEQLSTIAIVTGSTLALAAALAIPSMLGGPASGGGQATPLAGIGGPGRVVAADAQGNLDGSGIEGIPANGAPAGAPDSSPTAGTAGGGDDGTSSGDSTDDGVDYGGNDNGGDGSGDDGGTTGPADAVDPPAGFPDASTTGYRNAPGYPGSLSRFSGQIESNKTYKFMDFPGGVAIGKGVVNVTFIGCRFTSNAVVDATVSMFGDDITFSYSSFEPSVLGTARTVNYRSGYQYAIDQRAPGALTVDNSDFWGWGNGIQFAWSTKSNPVVVRDSYFHHARTDGNGVDHTDAILESYGGPSYMVFDHNTIVSEGNTNGLALQGPGYSNVTVTRNYFSGFGYTVSLGVRPSTNHNMVFTGNTFGTDIKPGWGPLYGWSDGNGNLWRKNKWHVADKGFSSRSQDNGLFWWPSGNISEKDYSG